MFTIDLPLQALDLKYSYTQSSILSKMCAENKLMYIYYNIWPKEHHDEIIAFIYTCIYS
jgi:hypothetical protein